MNLSILFTALLSSCLLRSASSSSSDEPPPMKGEQHPKMNCFPTSCGRVNISYPFWVEGKQPPHCGFPNFKLTCTDKIPILEMSPGKFQVKEIFYSNDSVWLGSPQDINNTNVCTFEYWTLSFGFTPFTISSANKNLTFFSGCSEPHNNYYRIPCAANNETKFAYFGEDLTSLNSCETVVIPVWDNWGADVSEYLRLLNNGFLVNWTAADCTDCSVSKGQCGYDNETNGFMCICPDRAHARMCTDKINKSINAGKIIGIAGGGVAGVFILCCVCFIFFKRRKRLQQSGSSNLLASDASSKISSKKDLELGDSNYHTHIFSYDELEEATNSFNASRELGDGGFGTVYKGKLRDGRTVAVKRLYEHNYRRLEQFMNEVEILSRLRHQNLVTLYGCTSRHSRELLLVYEYIPNGTVADHLNGPLASKGPLSWSVRMSIAIETADALAYLHAVEPQIIHRDVKTNNILLDSNFHVKVADFGLSRLFPLDATHVSTAPQGTPGYVDPEYHQCYQLTDKSDVYSFGVVLIELISSKPAVDISRHRHEINLANLAVTKIQNRQVDHLVDPKLGYEDDSEIRRMINQVAEIAFRCLQLDREMRPSIKEVLEVLRGIESVAEKDGDTSEAHETPKEERRLLKSSVLMCSPDSVAERWESSRSTTPNTST